MWKGLDSVAEGFGDPFEHSDETHLRPIISDEAKTAQFPPQNHPTRHAVA